MKLLKHILNFFIVIRIENIILLNFITYNLNVTQLYVIPQETP